MAGRIAFKTTRPTYARYRDSIHAGLVAALRKCGATDEMVIGPRAAPWTFAVEGTATAKNTRIRSITISTPDERLGQAMAAIEPAQIAWTSTNGDSYTFANAERIEGEHPVGPSRTDLLVAFPSSPFVISMPKDPKDLKKKAPFADRIADVDLSKAFSAGLARRMGRPIKIDAIADRLSILEGDGKPTLVRTRKTGGRDLIIPAHATQIRLMGKAEDLYDAYFAGLGEKTRYGFGCPIAIA
jgi:hypothetical protein